MKEKVFERTEKVAEELKLPLVKLESDFQNVLPQNHYRSHTYMDALAIYSLQKLWRTYYYASAYPFNEFTLKNNSNIDPAHFELFLLNCFSTSQLKIIPEGSEVDRTDKIKFISNYAVAQKNLHVCTSKETNCGVCEKCLRTLLAIDALNKLDNFREVFDIDAYIKNRVNIYLLLFQKYILEKNPFYKKTFNVLYNRHKDFFDSIMVEKSKK